MRMNQNHEKVFCSGKRYLCLTGVSEVMEITPFTYAREKNMDDWIIVDDIDDIKVSI